MEFCMIIEPHEGDIEPVLVGRVALRGYRDSPSWVCSSPPLFASSPLLLPGAASKLFSPCSFVPGWVGWECRWCGVGFGYGNHYDSRLRG